MALITVSEAEQVMEVRQLLLASKLPPCFMPEFIDEERGFVMLYVRDDEVWIDSQIPAVEAIRALPTLEIVGVALEASEGQSWIWIGVRPRG